jgi:hypothetical protein
MGVMPVPLASNKTLLAASNAVWRRARHARTHAHEPNKKTLTHIEIGQMGHACTQQHRAAARAVDANCMWQLINKPPTAASRTCDQQAQHKISTKTLVVHAITRPHSNGARIMIVPQLILECTIARCISHHYHRQSHTQHRSRRSTAAIAVRQQSITHSRC